jgi:hypothetical protein
VLQCGLRILQGNQAAEDTKELHHIHFICVEAIDPKDVHARYEDYVSNLEAGYSETWYATGFCDLLLFNQGAFQAFADQIEDALDYRRQSAAKAYYQFVKEQKSTKWKHPKQMDDTRYIQYIDLKWPVFDLDCLHAYWHQHVILHRSKRHSKTQKTNLRPCCLC